MIEIGILLGVLIVVIVTFFVLRAIGIPLHIDPFGKMSVGLIEDLTANETVDEAKNWRMEMIDEAFKKGEKNLFVKVGEFGEEEMLNTVDNALKKDFNVKVVAGNKALCGSKERIINLLEKFPRTFKYYILDHRPEDHFAIIGKSNLFIEVPHNWNATIKKSLGVRNAHKHILDQFYTKFEQAIKTSKEVHIDSIKDMPCYIDVDKTNQDDDV